MNYFITAVRFEKVLENGLVKKVTERYLVDALSFTEAESRTIEEMRPFISGEFSVTAVKTSKFSELFLAEEADADIFYKVKIQFITLDERTGNEKKTSAEMLVEAADLRDAIRRFDEGMKGTMADYQIVSVAEMPIVGIISAPLAS